MSVMKNDFFKTSLRALPLKKGVGVCVWYCLLSTTLVVWEGACIFR